MLIDRNEKCYYSVEIYIKYNRDDITVWLSQHRKYDEIDLERTVSDNLEAFVNMASGDYDNTSKVYDWYLIDEEDNPVDTNVPYVVNENVIFKLIVTETEISC